MSPYSIIFGHALHFTPFLLSNLPFEHKDDFVPLQISVKRPFLGLLCLPLSAWDRCTEYPLASRLASHQLNAPYKALHNPNISVTL